MAEEQNTLVKLDGCLIEEDNLIRMAENAVNYTVAEHYLNALLVHGALYHKQYLFNKVFELMKKYENKRITTGSPSPATEGNMPQYDNTGKKEGVATHNPIKAAMAKKDEEYGEGAVRFVQQVKRIMLLAEKDNGTEKVLTSRGNGGTYQYMVDGKGFCKVMDELLACHEQEIKDYLKGATAKDATAQKYVAPFIGFVVDTHHYSAEKMPKKDMRGAFVAVYGKDTAAVAKMSNKNPPREAQRLYDITKGIMIKRKGR